MLSNPYKVLLIVPDFGLAISPEIDSFYPNGYKILPIQGDVTRERIMKNIANNQQFDIIHYAGHAGTEGIRLSNTPDGQVVLMEAPALVQIARAVKAKLVFINGCSSIMIGQFLIDEHVPCVICTLSDIDNIMARETAQLFYTSLAETNDIRTAFDLSKPPIKGAYVILNNGVDGVSLKPVLDKLAKFDIFIQRNDREHQEIIASIAENEYEHERQINNIINIFHKSRTWSVAIMLSGMAGVGIIIGLFTMLGRGALP